MRKTIGWSAVIGLFIAGFSTAFASHPVRAAAPELDLAAGRSLFVTYCASCHGRDGRGNGPVAQALKVPPKDLTKYAANNGGRFPAVQVVRTIDGRAPGVREHGPIEMPVWGDAFTRHEGISEDAARDRIDAIARFIDSIQERKGH